MTSTPSPTAEFQLDPRGASKRPDQLVSLLSRELQQAFPDEFAGLAVVADEETGLVQVTGLEALDPERARVVVHRARAVYNDFGTSPWY